MEVFTGTVPFSDFQAITAVVKITEGERPPRPINPTLTDDVWALIQGCWDEDPQSRPGMRGVLKDLASSLLRGLYRLIESSPGFQVALSQFYDNTERGHCVDSLCGVELKEFINFLDDVRLLLNCLHPNPIVTLRIGSMHQRFR